jgi:hypothetical protein
MSQRNFERAARKRQEKAQRRGRSSYRRAGLAAGAVGAAVLFAPGTASAATTFEVNTNDDAGADGCTTSGGVCTLRNAVGDAATGDTITFAPTVRGTITLTQGQIEIDSGVTIQGPGAPALTVSGLDTTVSPVTHSRVFQVDNSGPVRISGLTIANGDGTEDAGGADSKGDGGAILNEPFADLTLVDSLVTGSQAGVTGDTRSGGGIESLGSLGLTNSVVSHNVATSDGGGIESKYDLTATDSTVSGNSAMNGGGIAAYPGRPEESDSPKYTTILRSTISDNHADPSTGAGGGIDFGGSGGTVVSQASISDSTIAGNSADIGGGIHAGNTPPPPPPPPPGLQAQQDEEGDGSLAVENTTVASNNATTTGGGIGFEQGVTDGTPPGLNSTIVANNTAGSADKDISTLEPGLTSAYSLIEVPGSASIATDGSKPTITGQDPQLGALADNGGPTQTKLPAITSAAIDQGTANGLTIDQRHLARTVDLGQANASDGTDIGAVEVPRPGVPVTPSSTPSQCGRRAISLVRADIKGKKVKLTGLVGSKLYGKKVTIQTNLKGARSSAFTKTKTVKASSKTGSFTATVPKPAHKNLVSVRYRAKAGSSVSPVLKLPQSLTSRSVKSAKGTITVKGHVKLSVLGKRNRVKVRRLVCGRYRTVGSARPDAKGNYTVTFKSTSLRGVSFYRAESHVLRKRGSKVYVIQYARAIAIRTTSQTG